MVDTYRDHMRQRLRADEPKGYLDYLLERVDQDTHGGTTQQERDAKSAMFATVLGQIAGGADRSRATPNRQPSRVTIRTSGDNPIAMAGLFGGGPQQQHLPGPPLTIIRNPGGTPPGWDVGQTMEYEDRSYGVPYAHSDPTLMLLQEWLNRRFPNDG